MRSLIVTRNNGETVEDVFNHDGRPDGQKIVLQTRLGLVAFHPAYAVELKLEKAGGRADGERTIRVVLEIPFPDEGRLELRAKALPGSAEVPLGGVYTRTHRYERITAVESAD